MLHVSFQSLPRELCNEPVSLLASDGESGHFSCNGPAEDGTVVVVGLSGKFGENPSTNGIVTRGASTPLCNRHSETRPSVLFPSSSENLASPVPGEIFNFTRSVCGFPCATFTQPAYIFSVCLKKAKRRPDRKGQPGGKFADQVRFFSENRVEYRCHWVG